MHFTVIFAFQMIIDVLIRLPFNCVFKFKVHIKNSLNSRKRILSTSTSTSSSSTSSTTTTHHLNHSQRTINHQHLQDSPNYLINEVQLTLLKYLPLRTISRLWGFMTSLYLPTWLRPSILGCYSRLFNCQLKEAEIDDFRLYPNLRQFFTRSLKPGLRPIALGDNLVSPVDGTVLHFGVVKEGNIEQIKGVNFTIRSFLGPQNWNQINVCKRLTDSHNDPDTLTNYTERLKVNQDNCLYNCTIYLAPGDYHRFHSPAQWKVNFRRHFPGYLLSVHPSFVGRVKGLFTINERVSYLGSWAHGFFSMTAVGATNVGSVKTYVDPSLKTNKFNWRKTKSPYNDKTFDESISYAKGDPFGEFNLGSTIVLLFEGPRKWKFSVSPGSKVKYGQLLFSNNTVNQANNNKTPTVR